MNNSFLVTWPMILLICYSFSQPLLAQSADTYTFAKAEQAQQFTNLVTEIRCVVCQNQNIADSNAPLANDLREKIYLMVQAQQSDQAIKDYLVKRYGEFILLKPPVTAATLLLWIFPGLAILSVIGIIMAMTRRSAVFKL